MIRKRYYYNHDDDHSDNETHNENPSGPASFAFRKLTKGIYEKSYDAGYRKGRLTAIKDRLDFILNPEDAMESGSRRSLSRAFPGSMYMDKFLLGGRSNRLAEEKFRNDEYLIMDFGALMNIHNKLKDTSSLNKNSSFYSWLKSLYEDPLSKFPWISRRGDINAGMPALRPDVKGFLLNLRMLFKLKTFGLINDLKITIIPVAQDKLLVLTVIPPSTHFEFHGKQIESVYTDTLKEIFDSGNSESRDINNQTWDFEGYNKKQTINLKFEFKFLSTQDFTKKDKFLSVSRKRVDRTNQMIRSFKNFFSQHNKRHYDFSEEDFLAIDDSLTETLDLFRREYQKYFEKLDDSKRRESELERDIRIKNIHSERAVLETEERLKENIANHQYELKKMNDKINQLNEVLIKAIEEKK